jgi:threonyl-tRNA synthetase
MPSVTLPDGSQRKFDQPVPVGQVAADIGPGLAKAALAGRIDGRLVDTSHTLKDDSALEIVTGRDADGLEIIRHSTAHLLAQAVKQLFPEAQVTIGPVIEDGFYYDFAFERPFTPEDLEADRAADERIGGARPAGPRKLMPRDEAVAFLPRHGRGIQGGDHLGDSGGEDISLYGRTTSSTCAAGRMYRAPASWAFKLTKVAGAYWRGDHRNEMLQRIYGTAWASNKELKDYLQRLEEAEKRDHRRIGKQLGLFHTQEEAPGMVFWHDRGWTIYTRHRAVHPPALRRAGYQESTRPRWWTACCGRSPGTGTSSARACSTISRRAATTQSSR